MMRQLIKAWYGQSEASRLAVLGELRGMADDWKNAASDDDSEQDAKSLALIVSIIESLEQLNPETI